MSVKAAAFPNLQQYSRHPCLATRFRRMPDAPDDERQRVVTNCVNPPAPGIIFFAVARMEAVDTYLEVLVFEDWATLLHRMARIDRCPDSQAWFRQLSTVERLWMGDFGALPAAMQPAWHTAYTRLADAAGSPAPTKSATSLVTFGPANPPPSVSAASPLNATPCVSSGSSDATSARSEVCCSQPGRLSLTGGICPFSERYYSTPLHYEAAKDPGGAHIITLVLPHTFEPEPVRFTLRPSLSFGARALPRRRVYQHRPFAAVPLAVEGRRTAMSDAAPGTVTIADAREGVARLVEMSAAWGIPSVHFGGEEITASTGATTSAAGVSEPRNAPHLKPRNVVVELQGPSAGASATAAQRVRCFADVEHALGGRAPVAGEAVAVELPGFAGLRPGRVVAVSAWCKRKWVQAGTPALPRVVAFATAADVDRTAWACEHVAGPAAAAAHAFVRGVCSAAAAVEDVWAAADGSAVNVVVRLAAGLSGDQRRQVALELEHCVAKALPEPRAVDVRLVAA